MIGLDKQVIFLDNEQELILDNSDVEQIRRKEAKVERQKTGQNTLANASAITAAIDASLFVDAGVS